MRYPAAGTASYDGFSCQLLFVEGRICKKYTLPPDQARQPTFASEKSDGDGREETVEVIHIIDDIKGSGLRPSIRAEKKREV